MLTDLLHRHADRDLLLCDDGQRLRYAQALDLGAQPALRALHRRLVICLAANLPGSLLGYLGLLSAGAVPLMLNAALAPEQLAPLVAAYRPAAVLLPAERQDALVGGRLLWSGLGQVLLAPAGREGGPLHQDLALLLTTSGSTGSPKMVRLSQRNLLSNAMAIAEYLGIDGDERPVTALPPSYTYGLSIVHSHLVHGCTLALTAQTFFDKGFWQFMKEARVSSLGGVPYQFEMLRKLRLHQMDLPALRTLTQAGGRLDPGLAREFAQQCSARGRRLFLMYGQAEASPRMAYLAPDKVARKPHSIGAAIPGGRLRLLDEQGAEISAAGVAGELVYQGDNVCMGYAQGWADLAAGDEFGGVLHTGDMAERDAEGDFTIVGRLRRFLKLYGHRINLEDVERALQAEGLQAACAGSDDHLAVYLCGADADAARAAKMQLLQRLRLPPAAVRVLGLAELPRTDAGKVRYAGLPDCHTAVLA